MDKQTGNCSLQPDISHRNLLIIALDVGKNWLLVIMTVTCLLSQTWIISYLAPAHKAASSPACRLPDCPICPARTSALWHRDPQPVTRAYYFPWLLRRIQVIDQVLVSNKCFLSNSMACSMVARSTVPAVCDFVVHLNLQLLVSHQQTYFHATNSLPKMRRQHRCKR